MLLYRLITKEAVQISLNDISEETQEDVRESTKVQRNITIAEAERKQKMQLKIIHAKTGEGEENVKFEDGHKVVLVDRKTDTYDSLKKLVLYEYFGAEEVDPNLFRLRAFNVQFKIMQDTYDGREDLTLELLKIFPMKTLVLEEKGSLE